MQNFVHLRLHTEYALIDSVVRIDKLVSRVAALGMPAVAVSDPCNFYALVKFYREALSAGVKPIFAVDMLLGAGDQPAVLCLLAADQTGYRNLIKLISKAWQEGRQRNGLPRLERGWVADCSEGVIALSGGREGDIGQALIAGKAELAAERLCGWMDMFPQRFYLELQRSGRASDEDYLHAAVALAAAQQCPVVATNDVRFLTAAEFEAHETRVCISEGSSLDDTRRVRRYSEQQYLRSPEEMAGLFSDIPEALENTLEIARRCNVELVLGNSYLPDYPVPSGLSALDYLRQTAAEGLERRLQQMSAPPASGDNTRPEDYRARLDFELDVIAGMGYAGYFLIVMDFIRWARSQAIPVGPGRGSGAGSLVAWVLEITDIDPLAYDLLFERFLNPGRVSMPDLDIDFCTERRDQVINYVAETYGRDAVSQITTFGTMAARAVVRDVVRAQGKPYGLGDKLAKKIPNEIDITMEKAFEQEQELREFLRDNSDAGEAWDMALQLEGLTRNVSKHAGGVVIAPSKLTDFSPLFCDDSGTSVTTQFDMKDIEAVGLVKFDFLGLRTLTIIDLAVKIINAQRQLAGEQALDIRQLALDDKASFQLLQRAETTAVFQLESPGMRSLIAELLPDCFEDIVALVALYRPGVINSGTEKNFIARKRGREAIAYPDPRYQHESLRPILESTYGVILYQEQVMQIAQELAGYTPGDADELRRIMGKKLTDKMPQQREQFERGAADRGVDPGLAVKIFDLMEHFGAYGFNRSHSVAYALVAYQTAWLKAHYPAPFMAAVMSSEIQNTDKIVTLIDECRRMGLTLRLPDVNEGERLFTVDSSAEIIYGLGAIKGLGAGPIQNLLEARQRAGAFGSLLDFCARTDPHKINRRAIDAMIRAGACDTLGETRAVLTASLDAALLAARQSGDNQAAGTEDLFGDVVVGASGADICAEFRHSTAAWSEKATLSGEKQTLGLWLTGHPFGEYEQELRQFVPRRIADLLDGQRNQLLAGVVAARRDRQGKRQVEFVLDDRSGRIAARARDDAYRKYADLLAEDSVVVIEGTVRMDDFKNELCVYVKTVYSLVQARQRYAAELCIEVQQAMVDETFAEQLQQLLRQAGRGRCPVAFNYSQPTRRARIRLGAEWRVAPSDELIQQLQQCCGDGSVSLSYPSR